MKSNEAILRDMQTQMTNMKTELRNEFKSMIDARTNKIETQNNQIINILTNMQMQNSSGLGSLPSNTVANIRGDLKAITTRSGVSYDGLPIHPLTSSLPKVVERVPEVTKDTMQPTITFKVSQTSKYSYNDSESINRIDAIDVACEEYVHVVLGFFDNSKSGNPTPISDPIIALSSLSLTPFKGGDFILEAIEACLTCKSISPRIDDTDFDLEGDIRLLEELLNNDPSLSPLPPKELNVEEIKTVKSSIDEPPELELKELPSHLKHEVIKLLDAGLIDPIFDSPWVSPVHCVPKKGGMIVVENEDNELIPIRHIPKVHEAIFHDMIEKMMEVFMDDFSIFEDSFSLRLSHLDKMLKWCEDTNLVLNWENCHFMVKEGIFLGHKISKSGIEVDRAKVDVIAKLPHPTFVKEFDVIIRDEKRAENLTADHLSRLENPHQDELKKKEITETFPLETLGMIAFCGDSSTLWFANIANYHAGKFIVKGMS
nr:DNA-directed DNA polymerase [Tanacetum cinerariifolium]